MKVKFSAVSEFMLNSISKNHFDKVMFSPHLYIII